MVTAVLETSKGDMQYIDTYYYYKRECVILYQYIIQGWKNILKK